VKIAFLLDRFPALTQTFVLNQIVGAIDAGHDVDIYAMGRGSLEKVDRRVFEYGLQDRVRYIMQAPSGLPERLVRFAGLALRYGRRKPGPVVKSLNWMRFGRQAVSLKLFFKVAAFLENRERYDIIHCQFGMLGIEALAIRRTGAVKGKLVTSFRGYDTEKYLRRNPGAYDELLAEGDLFLPVCDSFAQWLRAHGCPPDRIRVIYSGIDCGFFKFRPRRKMPDEPVRLLTVARLVPKKGVRYAIEAVAGLLAEGKDLSYTIIGDGPLREELEDLVESRRLRGRIDLAGWKDRQEVLRYMEKSHIMITPSLTAADGDCEGIPNVLKEAMAMGMPVVGTYHSGIPELVRDGVCGLLAKEGDAADLKRCIARLVSEESKWEEYGKNGRRIIEERFDNRKVNQQLLESYCRLVRKAKSIG